MERSEKVKYWLDLSDEDIKVAKHLLNGNMFGSKIDKRLL